MRAAETEKAFQPYRNVSIETYEQETLISLKRHFVKCVPPRLRWRPNIIADGKWPGSRRSVLPWAVSTVILDVGFAARQWPFGGLALQEIRVSDEFRTEDWQRNRMAYREPIDLLYLDADGDKQRGKGIYLEILRACYDRLPNGAIVLAHNSVNAATRLGDYLAFVRDDANCRASINVILDPEGLEVSVK